MLKLAIAAGITLTALLCGMMTLRSSGLFQNSNKNGELINDIKEIFGFPPITTNAQLSFKSEGDGSSFSFAGGGGYLPPKSASEDDDSAATDITTPVFRIFILSTATPPNGPNNASSATDTLTTPTYATTASSSTSPSQQTSTTLKEPFKEEALAEATTVASVTTSSTSPTPYSFQGNPSPAFKIDLVWSTLTPPSLSNSENEVAMNENSGYPAMAPNNNGLYLPPNKEYLPPKQ